MRSEHLASEVAVASLIERAGAVVFDLDGTLYDDWQFLGPAYRRASEVVAAATGVDPARPLVTLIAHHRHHGPTGAFQAVLERFGLPAALAPQLLAAYRDLARAPGIAPYAWAGDVLEWLQRRGTPVAVLTNGHVAQQRWKVAALRESGLVQLDEGWCVYASELEPKPSPAGLLAIAGRLGLRASALVMVGDSDVDRTAAAAAGCPFVAVSDLSASLGALGVRRAAGAAR